MKGAKVIILNVIATYARSLLSFVFGLFTVRWILEALGHSDYGLYGVVGGVMVFISMLNSTQSATVARFYAYSIGNRQSATSRSDELCNLFNTAVAIHLALPFVLIGLGYPIGVYAFRHWLNVPDGRMDACIFVFRCSMAGLFVSTLTVPYMAMFVAYQLIRQLVLFSLVNVFGSVVVAWSLLRMGGDRLKCYAFMMLCITIVVCALHCFFAKRQFAACRISFEKMFSFFRTREILKYTFIKFLGDIAWCGRNVGNAFVTNINFGTLGNAAVGIGGQLSGQAESLCATLANAFAPAITTEEGAGHRSEVVLMALRCCKFGSLLLMLVALPLLIEMDFWLDVWLKNPPVGASGLCACYITTCIITYLTKGHQLAIQANGVIGRWQLCDSIGYLSGIPCACLFAWLGMGLLSIGYAHIVSIGLVSLFRLIFARFLIGASIRTWFVRVVIPISLVWGVAFSAVELVSFVPLAGFLHLFVVVSTSTVATCLFGWMLVFTAAERQYFIRIVKSRLASWMI